MTTRDISSHIKDIYGFGISETMVSKITNKILPTIEEWQNRPLEKIYPMVFLDAIHYHVRENNIVVKKAVFKAPTEDLALTNLGIFEEKWDKKYPMCVNSWKNNWAELSTYFKYPEGIRKLIYTTNAMENFNRQLRKVTKNKTIFPNDYALQKSLYLAMVDASSKWTYRIRGWDQILS